MNDIKWVYDAVNKFNAKSSSSSRIFVKRNDYGGIRVTKYNGWNYPIIKDFYEPDFNEAMRGGQL